MNVENFMINDLKKEQILTGQQMIEYDILLPDYYDNIGKIMKCSVLPYVETVTCSGDRISIAGSLQISVLYVGEDENLYCYDNEYKYTKILNNSIELNDNYFIEQELLSLNYRAVGPKRIDIKGMLQLSARIYCREEFAIVQDVIHDGIYCKKTENESVLCKGIYSRSFSLSDDISVDGGCIKSIIRKDCKVNIDEKKIIANKVYMKGICKLILVYITEDTNTVKSIIKEVPFSEVIDIYSLEECDSLDICNVKSKTSCNLKSLENGNSNISVNIDLSFNLKVSTKTNITFVEDVYSTVGEIDTEYSELLIENYYERKLDNFVISFEADVFSESDFDICDCNIDCLKVTTEQSDEQIKIIVNADYCALIKQNDGLYNYVIRNITKEYLVENENKDTKINLLDVYALSVSALHLSGGKIKFSADYFVDYILVNSCKVNTLTKILCDDLSDSYNEKGFMVYFAQKGESLWDIAKENKTQSKLIMEINDINSEKLSDDKMLVFPIF